MRSRSSTHAVDCNEFPALSLPWSRDTQCARATDLAEQLSQILSRGGESQAGTLETERCGQSNVMMTVSLSVAGEFIRYCQPLSPIKVGDMNAEETVL